MKKICSVLLCALLILSCSTSDDASRNTLLTNNYNSPENNDNTDDDNNDNNESTADDEIKILSLGDSYTIGQSVCVSCRFPVQLRDSLDHFVDAPVLVDIIAQTGWTTGDLLDAIADANPTKDHDIVTLLIGVNNQYQNKPFSQYTQEFPILVNQAIEFAQNDKNNVIVISIPDYAYTPFGQNFGDPEVTSSEIDEYNTFAQNYCFSNGITFLNITDITREGLDNPDLVASDNLHPSTLAYSRFVERLLPIALEKLE